jgi:hypothetical protein
LTRPSQGYPYVNLMTPYAPVVWHEKFFALRMALSQGVRINSRGVRFIDSDHSRVVLRAASSSSSSSAASSSSWTVAGGFTSAPPLSGPPTGGWASIPCEAARDSLCHIVVPPAASNDKTAELRIRVFPNSGSPAYTFPLLSDSRLNATTLGTTPAIWDAMVGAGCPESATGRTSTLGPSGGGGDSGKTVRAWDLSVCNVIGGGWDFVFMPFDGVLFVLARPVPFHMVVIISILTMVMSIVLAHNLEFSLGTTNAPTR